MRTLLLAAALSLASALAADPADAQEARATAAFDAPAAASALPSIRPLPATLVPDAPRHASTETRESSAAVGRSEDFLYQVLLTAVSTLVAALIWKAVS